MGKGIGLSCIALGVICLVIAFGRVAYNHYEEKAGEQASQSLLQDVQKNMNAAEGTQPQKTAEDILPEEIQNPIPLQMLTVPVDDYESIGILTIPVIELELPVLTDWNYEKLKKAPCHYYGSCYTSNFVITAHNYDSHFGGLPQLQAGDLVIFTDVTGQTHNYEVVLLETLPPTATEEMITSGFDLSLYTCTPGGNNRVTVRCNTANK